jgi:hypothetical protein
MTIYDQIMLTNPDLFKVLAALVFCNVWRDRQRLS